MQKLVAFVRASYSAACTFLNRLQSPLLLAIRLYWGWQFAQDGWGKLTHLARVTQFFTSLNLPAPGATAALVAQRSNSSAASCSRAALPRGWSRWFLFVNMTMAYLSVPDDRVNFSHILSNPSDFYGATPYTYWFAALLILILGPGLFSLDTLIGRRFSRSAKAVHSAVS